MILLKLCLGAASSPETPHKESRLVFMQANRIVGLRYPARIIATSAIVAKINNYRTTLLHQGWCYAPIIGTSSTCSITK